MKDRMRDVCELPGTAGISRRRMLGWCAAAVTLPPVLAACSPGSGIGSEKTQALLALADQARADTALIVAAVTADPALAERLEPLRAARIDHAAALDTAAGRTAAATATPPAPDTADLARVRDAAVAASRAASDAVPRADAAQVGLLAEVAACCATYGSVLA